MAIQVGQLMATLGLNAKGFNKGMTDAGQNLTQFSKQLNAAGSQAKSFNSTVTKLGVAAGAAGYALVRMGKEAFKVAADVAEMNVAIGAVGKATGIGGENIRKAANDIRAMGIEMKASQEIAMLFVKGNMDLTKAAKMARVAQDLAVISQSNSTETAQLLSYAIQTGNSRLLKSAGITKYASEAYAQYARELKKTENALTATERQQAILNMILEEGQKVSGVYEASMQEAGKVLRSFPRIINDIQLEFGKLFLDGFGPVILAAYKTTSQFSKMLREGGALNPVLQALTQTFTSFVSPLKGIFDNITMSLKMFEGFSMSVDDMAASFQKLIPVVAGAGTALSLMAGRNILGALPVVGKYAKMIGAGGPLMAGFAVLIATSPKLRGAFVEIASALKPLIPAAIEVGKAFTNVVIKIADIAGEVATALAGPLAASVEAVAIGVLGLSKVLIPVIDAFATLLGFLTQNTTVVQAFAAIVGGVLLVNMARANGPIGLMITNLTALGSRMVLTSQVMMLEFKKLRAEGVKSFAAIRGAGTYAFTSLATAAKTAGLAIMSSLGPMILVTAAVFAAIKIFTAWSQRNKDVEATTKSLNNSLKEQMGLLKGNEEKIVDYLNSANTLDKVLLKAEDSGDKLASSLSVLTGSSENAARTIADMKYDVEGTTKALAEQSALGYGPLSEAVQDYINRIDKVDPKDLENSLRRGIPVFENGAYVFKQLSESQIQAALALEELQDQAENTKFEALVGSLIKNTINTSKYGLAAVKAADAIYQEKLATGELATEFDKLEFYRKTLAEQLELQIKAHEKVEKVLDSEGNAINNSAKAVNDLIQAMKEGELTAEMFKTALMGNGVEMFDLNRRMYEASKSLYGLLEGMKKSKGDMVKLTDAAYGLHDQMLENAQSILEMGGNAKDVAAMMRSLYDQFVTAAKAAGFTDEQIGGLLERLGIVAMVKDIEISLKFDIEQAKKAFDAYVAMVKATGVLDERRMAMLSKAVTDAQAAFDAASKFDPSGWNALGTAAKNGAGSVKTYKDAVKALTDAIKNQKKEIKATKRDLVEYAKSSMSVMRDMVSMGEVFSLFSDERARAQEDASRRSEMALQREKDALRAVAEETNDFANSLGSAVRASLSFSSAIGRSLSALDDLRQAQARESVAQSEYNAAYSELAGLYGERIRLEKAIANSTDSRRRLALSRELAEVQVYSVQSTERLMKAQEELEKALNDTNEAGSRQITFLQALEEQAKKAQEFGAKVSQLAAAGLSRDALRQVIEAGAEAGTAIADELIGGGSEAIAKANQFVGAVKEAAENLTSQFAVAIEDESDVLGSAAQTASKSFFDVLNEQAKKSREFSDKVKQLIALGLRGPALEEVVNAGVDAGTKIANELIAGGANAIQQSMEIANALKKEAEDLGIFAAPYFDQTGVTLAEQLLKAFRKKLAELPKILKGATSKDIEKWFEEFDDFTDNFTGAPAPTGTGGTTGGGQVGSTLPYPSFMAAVRAQHPNSKALQSSTPVTAAKSQFPKLYQAYKDAGLALAKGGIVSSPTVALIGEKGPEAVVPLNKGYGGNTYNIVVNAGMGANGAEIGDQIVDALKRYQRRNGALPLTTV